MEKILRFGLLVMLASATLLGGEKTAEEKAVTKVVIAFAKAADAQDTEAIQKVLHAEASQYFVPAAKLIKLSTPQFLSLINDKKVGGVAREITIHHVDVNGTTAQVKAVFESDAIRFDNYLSLMAFDGKWQIMSIVIKLNRK